MKVSVEKGIHSFVFAVCCGIFIWQAFEIIKAYFNKEIATKIEIRSMKAEFSQFDIALCLDQFNTIMQVTNRKDSNGEMYNLNRMDEMGKILERYDGSLQSLYGEQLFRKISKHVNISVDFVFADDTTAGTDVGYSMYHPLYGYCRRYLSASFLHEKQDHLSEAVVASVIVRTNISSGLFNQTLPIDLDDPPGPGMGEPNLQRGALVVVNETNVERSQSGPRQSPLLHLRPELFNSSLQVKLFVPDQFHMTAVGLMLKEGSVEEVYLRQDVTERNKVKHFSGKECTDDPDYNEDECLDKCMVNKFIQEANCVHPRLMIMIQKNGMSQENIKVCTYKQLENITQTLNTVYLGDKSKLDPGVSLIKRITYGFSNSSEERCDCPKPCLRRHSEIRRWKNHNLKSTSTMEAVININQLFYYYEDSPTYDCVKLWADLGGFLGLMLGYCAYNVADLINYFWEMRQRKREENQEEPS